MRKCLTKDNLINKCIEFWQNHNAKLVLIILLLVFSIYSVFLVINLQEDVVPDESYRFEVSRAFSETWGIPNNAPITLTAGEDLHRNPFLGYWLFGRVLFIYTQINPDASIRQELVALRMVNGLFALGTSIVTYLISKELIKNKWWQLLPVFMLTNTLMFVFLSGGVSYDNPTNFICALGLLFFIRVMNHKDFIMNSLGWMISIGIGTLIKHSVLPLVPIMGIIWIVYIIRNKEKIQLSDLRKKTTFFITAALLIIVLGFNINLYGVNLIKFQSFRPSCTDTFSEEICENSVFVKRHQEMALPEKLTIITAFQKGYPEPIRFTFELWIPEMIKRVFGIMGHQDYFPVVTSYFQIAFYWMLFLGFRYIKKPSFKTIALTSIFGFYALVLMIMNYNSELAYGFYKFVALQGRYIFPVISIAFVLSTYILTKVTNKYIRIATLIATIALFLYGGPIRFLWYYDTVFKNWFI
jgi:4-amino-4-deoxy-L-arabinose transferase-like glycosyltransferase